MDTHYRTQDRIVRPALALATLLTAHLSLHAQAGTAWLYGDEFGELMTSFAQLPNGSYILAGDKYNIPPGGNELFLAKVATNGALQWSHIYGAVRLQESRDVVPKANGGYYFVGQSDTNQVFSPNAEVLLMDLNADGEAQWIRTYGGPYNDDAVTVVEAQDGCYVLGSTPGTSLFSPEGPTLMRVAANGDLLWTKSFANTEGSTYVDGGCRTAGTDMVFTGRVYRGNDDYDVMIFRVNADGDVQWAKLIGGPDIERGRSVVATTDGGIAFAAITEGFGTSNDGLLVGRLSGAGELLWGRVLDGTGSEELEGQSTLAATSDGGFLVLGHTTSGGHGSRDGLLAKFNATGDLVFSRALGDYSDDRFHSVHEAQDQHLVVGGFLAGGISRHALHLHLGADGNGDCYNMPLSLTVLNPALTATELTITPDTVNLHAADFPMVDGTFGTDSLACGVVGMADLVEPNGPSLQAWPLADGRGLQVVFAATAEPLTLDLWSTDGRLLRTTALRTLPDGRYNWPLPYLPDGAYVLTARGPAGTRATRVVMHR